ncbi:MAG: hypothetical protein H0T78_05415 [Longispora sp.]|nr:hypothetical protein [Longispora sp. (in: high G+C Gram-positive bacteria)]
MESNVEPAAGVIFFQTGEASRECGICLDVFIADILDGEAPVLDQLGCGHIYHHDCLTGWVSQSVTHRSLLGSTEDFKIPMCPKCNRDLREDPTTHSFSTIAFTQREFTSAGRPGQIWVRDVSAPIAAAAPLLDTTSSDNPDTSEPARRGEPLRVRSQNALDFALANPNVQEIILIPDTDMTIDQLPTHSQATFLAEKGSGRALVYVYVDVNLIVAGGNVHAHDTATITAVTGGGDAYIYETATIGTVASGKVYASDAATIGTVTGGAAFAEGTATITTVTGGRAYASDTATIGTVTGGAAMASDTATIGTITGGTAKIYDNAIITTITGGTVLVEGQARIEHAGGNATIIAQGQSQVTVGADGDGVTLEAHDQAVITCYAGTVSAYSQSTVVSDGGNVIAHSDTVTIHSTSTFPDPTYEKMDFEQDFDAENPV